MTSGSPKSLAYLKLGTGRKHLLAFHGIGQTGLSCYQNFAETFGQHYSTFAFDLPFHGANADFAFQTISKFLLKELVVNFLEKEKIARFDVAGFSMGGRFALAVLEAFPDRIDRVYLMAPDGITEDPLYSLATRWTLPRMLFKWTMAHPKPFFTVIKALQKFDLVNKSLARFTFQMLDSPEKRTQVYLAWIAFSPLHFNISKLYATASQNNVKIFLFTGKYDRLMRPEKAKPLAELLPHHQHIVLKSGHTQLVQQAGSWISSLLSKLSDT
ncbi:alpha/beta fold hydrolase [Dyadobacter sandarakinus]|uniref:Alpha/beta hydrolase n=1 Tax=Dyadobacter sandarakinus TaxID=2747268 RepID=A0ABX7I9N8_9BACT|nr:alpha/beta hydrolase [Dyadobacter sandarakinus]QRR02654.1 alpha/beta hydrolase [Dyadobacter sandarakinus]